MTLNESIELRLALTEEDPLYHIFLEIKNSLGIKSNSEVLRFIIKQLSKIPIYSLILDSVDNDENSSQLAKATEGSN